VKIQGSRIEREILGINAAENNKKMIGFGTITYRILFTDVLLSQGSLVCLG
jgi:hypothetical protein